MRRRVDAIKQYQLVAVTWRTRSTYPGRLTMLASGQLVGELHAVAVIW